MITKWKALGNPLVVQWLELRAFTTKGPHSIPGGETKIPQAIQWGQNKQTNKPLEKIFTRHMGKCEYLVDIKYTGIIANFFRRVHVALYFFFLEVKIDAKALGSLWSLENLRMKPSKFTFLETETSSY